MYKIISAPVPVNSTSNHATQLLNLAPYFLITANKQYYAAISDLELTLCTGKTIKYCTSYVALTPVTADSCILALFANDKTKVKSLCDFRFLHDIVKE